MRKGSQRKAEEPFTSLQHASLSCQGRASNSFASGPIATAVLVTLKR